jgi:hypothetical protein
MIICSWHSFFHLLAESRRLPLSALAITALLAAIATGSSADGALLKSYDFNGNYSDTLGNGVDLIPLGGSIAGGRYSFLDNQGLKLTSALPSTTDYAIEFRFRVEESNVTNYNKLIDFQELGAESDPGLYQYTGGLYFYSGGPTGGTVLPNTDYTVGLARSGGTLSVYLDGALVGVPYVDFANQAVSLTNVLDFFKDDNNNSESFPGSVDFIRIHNDSSTFGLAPAFEPAASSGLPEPSSLALLSLGVLGLIRLRQRKHVQSK